MALSIPGFIVSYKFFDFYKNLSLAIHRFGLRKFDKVVFKGYIVFIALLRSDRELPHINMDQIKRETIKFVMSSMGLRAHVDFDAHFAKSIY